MASMFSFLGQNDASYMFVFRILRQRQVQLDVALHYYNIQDFDYKS